MARRTRHEALEEDDSYFVSMTDLMVGLLFIFIIMLMVFALQYRQAEEEKQQTTDRLQQTTDRLQNSEEVRDNILDSLQRYLKDHGITVEIVKDQGILRLPEEILFDKASADVNQKGEKAIAILADALDQVLPCFTLGERTTLVTDCPAKRATIDSIFIEGHTDSDRLTPRLGMFDNFDLSAIRATNTYRTLIEKRTGLTTFLNNNAVPVLSVSGYGPYRPAEPDQSNEAKKSLNRRIDLRILMSTPRSEDASRFEQEVKKEMSRP